jgi:hypothetical protein
MQMRLLTRRLRPDVIVAPLALLVLAGCAQPAAPTAPESSQAGASRPVIPQEVSRALSGRQTAAAVTTATAPYLVGAAIDRVTASPGETISVLGWIASESTQTRTIDNNGFGRGFLNVVVVDQAGRRVFDWAASRPLSHGPMSIVPLAPGRAVTQTMGFSINKPGRYVATVSAAFRAQRPEASGGDMTPETTVRHTAVAPTITLTVR